jgi:hypothetical protein
MPADDTQVTEHDTEMDSLLDDDQAEDVTEDEQDFGDAFEEALAGKEPEDDDEQTSDDDQEDEKESDKEGDQDKAEEGKPDEAQAEEDDEDLKRGKELLSELEKEPDTAKDSVADDQEKDTSKGDDDDTQSDIVTSKRASVYAKIISPTDFEPRLTVGEGGEEVDVRDYLEANPEMPVVMGAYMQRVIENLFSAGVLADGRAATKEIDTLKQQIGSLRYELRVAAKSPDVFDTVESQEFKDWQKTAPKEALALLRSKNPKDFARGINLFQKTLKKAANSDKAQERDEKARAKMAEKKNLLSHKGGKAAGSGKAAADDFASAFEEAAAKENELEL